MGLDLSALEPPRPQAEARWVAPVAPLSAFEEDPDNPRFEDEGPEFDALVEDVRQRGILQPVVVRPMPSGLLRIRFGRRRYRAACALQLSGLAYVVTEDPRQFDDYAQVAENEQRKSLQPLELAAFIARKLAQKEKKKDIAARLALDASAVTHLLSLANEPPPLLLELYHSRRCRTPQYLYELRRLFALQPLLVGERAASAAVIDRRWLAALALEVTQREQRNGVVAEAPPAEFAAAGPEDEAQITVASTSERLRQPVLLGRYEGKGLGLLLDRRPSAAGKIWAMLDGMPEPVEIPIGAVHLTALEEGHPVHLRLVRGAEKNHSPGGTESLSSG